MIKQFPKKLIREKKYLDALIIRAKIEDIKL